MVALGNFSGNEGGATSIGHTRTQSNMTKRPPTMENWRSLNKKIIWKEILKHKEELSMSGSERLGRPIIKQIRNRIRRERRRRMKRESQSGATKMIMSEALYGSESHLHSRRTSAGFDFHSGGLAPIASQPDVLSKSAARQTYPNAKTPTSQNATTMMEAISEQPGYGIQPNAQIAQAPN